METKLNEKDLNKKKLESQQNVLKTRQDFFLRTREALRETLSESPQDLYGVLGDSTGDLFKSIQNHRLMKAQHQARIDLQIIEIALYQTANDIASSQKVLAEYYSEDPE